MSAGKEKNCKELLFVNFNDKTCFLYPFPLVYLRKTLPYLRFFHFGSYFTLSFFPSFLIHFNSTFSRLVPFHWIPFISAVLFCHFYGVSFLTHFSVLLSGVVILLRPFSEGLEIGLFMRKYIGSAKS